MDLEDEVEKPYTIGKEIKKLVNNKNLSDILFLIGEERKFVHCHKNIMSLGSPVFKSMFFGLFKESREQIYIPDLSPIGFLNIVKYIYGHKVDEFDLNDIYVTYVAGDKYLVHHLNENLINHVNQILDKSNCFILYEQLFLITSEIQTLKLIIKFIRTKSKECFEDEHFIQMSRDSLKNILNMESLNIDEIDVLKAVSRWVDEEANREETSNKHEIFRELKGLIRFSKLTITEMINFDKLDDLLTMEEIGSLFLHLRNKKQYQVPIRCSTNRNKFFTIFNKCSQISGTPYFHLRTLLNVNKKVHLKRIFTSLPAEVTGLNFAILENNNQLSIDLKISCKLTGWVIKFRTPEQLDPLNDYVLVFRFDSFLFGNSNRTLSNQTEFKLNYQNEDFIFRLNFDPFHCIQQIDFYD